MFKKRLIPANHSEEPRKVDMLSRLHDAFCLLCALFAARYLLMCVLSFMNALQDMQKFGGLGFTHSLLYYLQDYCFTDMVIYFFCVVAELTLYIVLCRRAHQKKTFWVSILYFFSMIGVHEVLWLHAHCLIPGHYPNFSYLDESALFYRSFAAYSILPAIAYFILYLFRVYKLKADKKS